MLLRLLNFESLVNVDFSNNQLESYRAYFFQFEPQLFPMFRKKLWFKFFLAIAMRILHLRFEKREQRIVTI